MEVGENGLADLDPQSLVKLRRYCPKCHRETDVRASWLIAVVQDEYYDIGDYLTAPEIDIEWSSMSETIDSCLLRCVCHECGTDIQLVDIGE